MGPALLVIAGRDYGKDGKVSTHRGHPEAFVIHIQPDGTVVADRMGGGNFDQPWPTPGFQAERRCNALRRASRR